MNMIFVFLAGMVATVLLYLASGVPYLYRDWRWHRRYQKMWDRASKEFDLMDPASLDACKAKWAEQPWRYEKWCDDRARYFDMRWNSGHTTEV
jgi:hypothetical protein